ncbi:MAG: twitching motility protein PilT [Verrucomicrobiota bacterium]|nr:twitching motility protein PilT [Verrucomicrobiota bacterium]
MTPEFTVNLLRLLFVTFTTFLGIMLGGATAGAWIDSSWVGGLAGAAFGLLIVLVDRLLKGISLRVFSAATFGLLIGFIFAQLLLASQIFARTSEDAQWMIGLIVYATFGYLGMMLAIRSNRDEFSLIIPYVRFRQATVQDESLLVDSNIVIDGRLPELCATGFVSSSLVVPRFVLDELQRLADSSDPLKRERGRLALERLQQMQRHPDLAVSIHESAPEEGEPVDTRLIKLAKLLEVRLLSNDANLCALARLQNVSALNINDLTRALRPTLDPGSEIELSLIKEGREPHQGIGYLSDGTMIVVNHARQHVGKIMPVVIASSHQTSAGRLFFGELK